MTSGKLVVSATKPVAMMKASAAGGENFSRSRIATTMGVSSSAAPSLANRAAISAPSSTTSGNSRCPRPLPQRATCSAAQVKNPASSRISEMMMSATKVKVASQTISHTMPRSAQSTTPASSATAAPPRALQPIPSPVGCHITSARVTTKIANASMNCPWMVSVGALVDAPRQRFGAFDSFRITVSEVTGASTSQPGELYQFLTDVHDAHVEWRRPHATCLVELRERLGHRRLVGDGEHAHPAPEDAHLIDRVEALAAAGHFHDRQRLALGRANTAQCQGDPVDLRLHHAGHGAMALRADPDHSLRPLGQLSQFPHLGMVCCGIVRQRQTRGTEGTHLATVPAQQSSCLLRRQTREGLLA